MLIIGLTTFALYGLIEAQYLRPLLRLQSVIFFYFFVENILKIHKHGFINFWYVPHDVFQESNNRYNLAIALLSVLTFIVVISLDRFEDVTARAILFLPMLRIFCVVNQIRVLFVAINRSLFKIFWLSIFGAVIFYFFAVCGIFLYAGAYQDFVAYNRTYSLFNFNSLSDALWTLFSCFVGAMITPVFVASIDTGEIFFSILYFLAFIIFFRLVFMKILVAILCDSYRRMNNIVVQSQGGSISTFQFWRQMKEEGRLEEGRFVTVKLRTQSDEGTSFEIKFSNKGGRSERKSSSWNSPQESYELLDSHTISKHAKWLSACTADFDVGVLTRQNKREVLECLQRWQATAKLLEDKLCEI